VCSICVLISGQCKNA